MTPCLERFAARPGFLDWNDADWGIRHGFLLPEDYAELRFRELDADGPDADDVVALRLADDNDERRDVIRRKASRTPEADERSGRKWAFATVEAIWLAHKDDPEALFREVHWFWEWELMDLGVDGALAPGLDRVLGFAPLTFRSRFRSWLQCRLPRGLRRHLWLRDLRRRFVPECSAWLREQEFLLRPVFAEGESVDSLLAKSRRFAKENGMRFDDEPFHNTRGCGFWFRLPRRRWGHAGCAFLKSRVFFYSEAFTFFGRMFERRDREFVPFDRLSAAKLFDYVLDERYRLLDIVRRRCWWRAFLDKRIRKRLRHDSIPCTLRVGPADKNGLFLADEPLIVEEHGDVLWFDSARSAAEYVEAVDVRNAEYRFFDAKGFRLAAEVYGKPEAIRFVKSGVPAREELAGILSRYCESLHLHPASDSLEDLLAAAKTKAHTV